jgi:hypothetical protein
MRAHRCTTYLLHYFKIGEAPVHYAGKTTESGVRNRIVRHRCGVGAKATRLLKDSGYRLTFFTIIRNSADGLELMLAWPNAARTACPLCNPRSPYAKLETHHGNRMPQRDGQEPNAHNLARLTQ